MTGSAHEETIIQPTLVAGVIVVNWNGYQATLGCLESLLSSDPGPERVAVVDNGSHDDSVSEIGDWATQRNVPHEVTLVGSGKFPSCSADGPFLTILQVDRNLGFAGGSNVGLRFFEPYADMTHFLLINNDANVAPDFFAKLTTALGTFPNAGLLTGTIFESDDRERVWYAGGRIRPIGTLATHGHQVPVSSDPVITQFVCGCAMLISREALTAVGRLAECYFPVYVEDVEYSYRVGLAGLPVVYVPDAKVYHRLGTTVQRHCTPAFVAYCTNRHRAFFVRRNLRGWGKVGALMYLISSRPVRALLELMSGRPRVAGAVMWGLGAGLLSAAATDDRSGSAETRGDFLEQA